MFRLDNKIAIVTGGASGIGLGIVQTYARQGANVHILDLSKEQGEQVAAEIRDTGGNAAFHVCDVADKENVEAVFDAVYASQKRIDIVVNNAGVSHIGTVETTKEEDLDRLYKINIKGVYHGLQAAVTKMLPSGGGVILNLASVASTRGLPDRFAYSMSKGAVLTMTLSVAADYVKKNIRCNCICPARVHTPFVDNYIAKTYPGREQEMFEKLSQSAPIGRMAKPAEIAGLATYLVSDEAAFATGGVFYLDGGMTTLFQ